jgi:hypothetical protein
MYDELVKRLREAPNDWYDADLHYEAADAIEKLTAFKAQITDGRFYVYKLGKLFELKHDPRELIVRLQEHTEPPKKE